ncbi:nucleotidyl transferase AbiEii/AbiGii toxin family protein [uncultured Sphingomonas sp.]|uniref:nucleotidyl transferase AbiEii/AbiGii toxin family protein n=1 Tax=uncultured Sphingomonas sp. TaxID=158754 RepID=UPI00261F3C04|nr:nucleotidyl transferase AbiEii/AbiGii toxin family protein [uncultured Sphingomonas sp.]
MLLHESPDFRDLIEITARDLAIDPGLVEKDYWIMHALWGLQQLGFRFELKGGTSLSKGYQLIHRFSEDIDILIHAEVDLPLGKNQNKPAQIAARRRFYDGLPPRLAIPGFTGAVRDHAFDDERMRSAGIRLHYRSINPLPDGVKAGILLETGFDQVAPNRPCLISSWAYDRALAARLEALIDNRAVAVDCYEPGYTLVEKLQTISTKFRRRQATGELPQNFMRHYYDVYCLLADESVQAFIGTDAYRAHKQARFPAADEKNLRRNPAFLLEDAAVRRAFETAYRQTRALYYRGQPEFSALIERIAANLARL